MSNIFRQTKSGRLVTFNLVRQCTICPASLIANEFWEVPAITYYGVLKRYNGSNWVKELLKTYNGSSFITKSLKIYNGTSWVLIDSTGV